MEIDKKYENFVNFYTSIIEPYGMGFLRYKVAEIMTLVLH